MLVFQHPVFGSLTFGNIAHRAGEITLTTQFKGTDGQIHREGTAILALAADFATCCSDDMRFARRVVAVQVTVMLAVIGFGHQHLHVLADDLIGLVTEQPLAGRVEALDGAVLIDGNDAVKRVIDHGTELLAVFLDLFIQRFELFGPLLHFLVGRFQLFLLCSQLFLVALQLLSRLARFFQKILCFHARTDAVDNDADIKANLL